MSLLNLRPVDQLVLSHLQPGEDPYRLFDGIPEPTVVSRIASEIGLDSTTVYYSLKVLKANHQVPKPPLEPLQTDLLTWQVQKAVTRLSDPEPFAIFDEHGEPMPGAVTRICQHVAYPFRAVQWRLAEMREGLSSELEYVR